LTVIISLHSLLFSSKVYTAIKSIITNTSGEEKSSEEGRKAARQGQEKKKLTRHRPALTKKLKKAIERRVPKREERRKRYQTQYIW
jgi:hypothetical protein